MYYYSPYTFIIIIIVILILYYYSPTIIASIDKRFWLSEILGRASIDFID